MSEKKLNIDTKAGLYEAIIEIHKKCGQGMSGLVKINTSNVSRWTDELIEEGFIKACKTGGSLGHPESRIFYMPTKGYNVWEDGEKENGNNHRFLRHIRLYLGSMDESMKESKKNDIKAFINPTAADLLRNPEFMEDYAKWLKRNKEALNEMMNLNPLYTPQGLSDDVMEFVKSKDWYKENLPLNDSIARCASGFENDEKRIELYQQLLDLYEKDDKYKKEANEEILKSKRNILYRNNIIDNMKLEENKEQTIQEWLETKI